MNELPFASSCESNKGPILEVLKRVLADRRNVLEFAAGTGQHATWCAEHMPHLHWQPTETKINLPVLAPRCDAYGGDNLAAAQILDVSERPWSSDLNADALFSANSLHIMPWASVRALFAELGEWAQPDTTLAVYGPFNYNGEYTSDSNARFDIWLAQQHPLSAIRHFEEIDALALAAGFELKEDNAMPANNRLLVWHRSG
mgnify:CR=1 FL=1